MIEKLYDLVENHESKEPQTVMDFLSRFAKDGDTEELFLAAVRDTGKIYVVALAKKALFGKHGVESVVARIDDVLVKKYGLFHFLENLALIAGNTLSKSDKLVL